MRESIAVGVSAASPLYRAPTARCRPHQFRLQALRRRATCSCHARSCAARQRGVNCDLQLLSRFSQSLLGSRVPLGVEQLPDFRTHNSRAASGINTTSALASRACVTAGDRGCSTCCAALSDAARPRASSRSGGGLLDTTLASALRRDGAAGMAVRWWSESRKRTSSIRDRRATRITQNFSQANAGSPASARLIPCRAGP